MKYPLKAEDYGVAPETRQRASAKLQRTAARAIGYHDKALSEAILHHCAVKVACDTAPGAHLVDHFVSLEIAAKRRLLQMPVADSEGHAVRARYLLALWAFGDRWEDDMGTVDALVAGLAGTAR